VSRIVKLERSLTLFCAVSFSRKSRDGRPSEAALISSRGVAFNFPQGAMAADRLNFLGRGVVVC
jgi:hypothetical protein